MDKVEFEVTLRVTGFMKDEELIDEAQARVAFELEQRINLIGDIRAHVTIVDGDEI